MRDGYYFQASSDVGTGPAPEWPTELERSGHMMLTETGEKATRIKRDDLLKIIKENRGKHRERFEKATAAYRERAVKELDAALADARAGRRIVRALSLPEPMDMTREYDRVIRKLELTVDEVVAIGDEEFAQYVMDDWRWKQAFDTVNASYGC